LEQHPVPRHVEDARKLAQADVHLAQIEQVLEAALRIDLDVLEVEALEPDLLLEAPMEVLDDLLADFAVVAAREKAHLLERLDQPVGVATDHPLEKLRDTLAQLRRQFADCAEVEQDERSV